MHYAYVISLHVEVKPEILPTKELGHGAAKNCQ
jgi:hypothetical protein